MTTIPNPFQAFEVELPAGGMLYLQAPEEVDLWQKSKLRYIEDYHLTNINDLHMLGAILMQQVTLFRAQQGINGMTPELDANNVPTGRYRQTRIGTDDMATFNKMMNTARAEISSIEATLGIDKKTRESGGQVSVQAYLRTLKKAAHERGIHLSRRILAYESFVNELRMKLRILRNADAEDRSYHDITPEKVLDWAFEELKSLEEVDKKWSKEKGKIYAGKL